MTWRTQKEGAWKMAFMQLEKEMRITQEAINASLSLRNRLSSIAPNKYTVGIGLKESGGRFRNRLATIVYVSNKLPAHEIPSAEIIPSEYAGFMTDVVEFRPIPISDFAPYNPLVGGININRISRTGNISEFPGTLGAIVRRRGDGKKLLLTCAHVVKYDYNEPDANAIGRSIFQPPEGNPGAVIIGKVSDLKFLGSPYMLDCAVIEPTSPTHTLLNNIVDIGPVKGVHLWNTPVPESLPKKVKKRGARTLYTEGYMVRLIFGATQPIVSGFEVISSVPGKAFAGGGDSGSVVLNENDEVEGLLYEISQDDLGHMLGTRGMAIPILNVLNGLNVDIAITPAISSIVPNNAVAAVNTFGKVVIEGWGLDSSSRVYFGSFPAPIVSVSPRRIEVLVPVSPFSGNVEVRIENTFGETSIPNPQSTFTYNIGNF